MALNDRPMLFRVALAGTLVAAMALSACGRKGSLEAAPAANVTSDPAADTGDTGPTKPDRPFFLDPLI